VKRPCRVQSTGATLLRAGHGRKRVADRVTDGLGDVGQHFLQLAFGLELFHLVELGLLRAGRVVAGAQQFRDFTGQLLQPLFDAGRNQANLQVSQAARDIAVAQYERAIQQAFREVADALAGRATLGDQLAAQQAQADAEASRLQLADLLYRGGAASLLDRLDAERSLLAARQAVVQLQLQRLQNAVLLYRVLGGGAGPGVAPAMASSTPVAAVAGR